MFVGWDDGVGGVWWLVAVTSLSAHTVQCRARLVTPHQECLVSATTGQPTLSIRLWVFLSYWVLKKHFILYDLFVFLL